MDLQSRDSRCSCNFMCIFNPHYKLNSGLSLIHFSLVNSTNSIWERCINTWQNIKRKIWSVLPPALFSSRCDRIYGSTVDRNLAIALNQFRIVQRARTSDEQMAPHYYLRRSDLPAKELLWSCRGRFSIVERDYVLLFCSLCEETTLYW